MPASILLILALLAGAEPPAEAEMSHPFSAEVVPSPTPGFDRQSAWHRYRLRAQIPPPGMRLTPEWSWTEAVSLPPARAAELLRAGSAPAEAWPAGAGAGSAETGAIQASPGASRARRWDLGPAVSTSGGAVHLAFGALGAWRGDHATVELAVLGTPQPESGLLGQLEDAGGTELPDLRWLSLDVVGRGAWRPIPQVRVGGALYYHSGVSPWGADVPETFGENGIAMGPTEAVYAGPDVGGGWAGRTLWAGGRLAYLAPIAAGYLSDEAESLSEGLRGDEEPEWRPLDHFAPFVPVTAEVVWRPGRYFLQADVGATFSFASEFGEYWDFDEPEPAPLVMLAGGFSL
jgi:hypothetical protein